MLLAIILYFICNANSFFKDQIRIKCVSVNDCLWQVNWKTNKIPHCQNRFKNPIENLCKDAKIDTLNTLTQVNSFTAIAWREYCKIISNYSDSVLSMLVHLYVITFLSYFDSACIGCETCRRVSSNKKYE